MSPHGLGLSEERSWSLTPREFLALQAVHEKTLRRWAISHSAFMNAHFRQRGEPAFEPEHFLGLKSRVTQALDSVKEKLEVMRANNALRKITEDDVPAWAKGPKEELRHVQ